MTTWTRVKDKRTGHQYSTAHVDSEHHEVLKDAPAVDAMGNVLPAKPNVNQKASPASDSKGK